MPYQIPIIVDCEDHCESDAAPNSTTLSRCVYFRLIPDENDSGWVDKLKDPKISIAFMGSRCVLARSDDMKDQFDDTARIASLFKELEVAMGLPVETDHLLIPFNSLRLATEQNETPERGDVFLISPDVFAHANSIIEPLDSAGVDAFNSYARTDRIKHARPETAAFSDWAAQVLNAAP